MDGETRYAKTVDGVHIAFQVRGDGPTDLVYINWFTANFEVELEDRVNAAFADRLASFTRLIHFESAGPGSPTGSRPPISTCGPTTPRGP